MNSTFRKAIQLLGFFFCLFQFLGKSVCKSSMSESCFASLIVTYWQVCHLSDKIKLIQPRVWQPEQQALGQSHHLRFAAGHSVGIHFAFVLLNVAALTLQRLGDCCMLKRLFPSHAHFLLFFFFA